jgi:hypothetical protein
MPVAASPLRPSHHHVDITAAALRANQLPAPFRHWRLWPIPACLLFDRRHYNVSQLSNVSQPRNVSQTRSNSRSTNRPHSHGLTGG